MLTLCRCPFLMVAKARTGQLAAWPSSILYSTTRSFRHVPPPISSFKCQTMPCTVGHLHGKISARSRFGFWCSSHCCTPPHACPGFPGPGDGVGDVSHNAWSNNMTLLIWTITSPFVSLNSTVYYTLNTSGRAPRGCPGPLQQSGLKPNSCILFIFRMASRRPIYARTFYYSADHRRHDCHLPQWPRDEQVHSELRRQRGLLQRNRLRCHGTVHASVRAPPPTPPPLLLPSPFPPPPPLPLLLLLLCSNDLLLQLRLQRRARYRQQPPLVSPMGGQGGFPHTFLH
jgi:hypothetical protein